MFPSHDQKAEHSLDFIPTLKDNKEQQIDKLRRMLATGQIEINPRCKQFIFQLRSAKWKVSSTGVRKGFERSKGDASKGLKDHHGDGIDAAVYMIRNIDYNRNPYPDNWQALTGTNVYNSHVVSKKNSKIQELMGKLMGQGKKS